MTTNNDKVENKIYLKIGGVIITIVLAVGVPIATFLWGQAKGQGEVATRITVVEKDIDTVKARITMLEQEQYKQNTEIELVKTNIGFIKTALDENKTDHRDIKNDMKEIKDLIIGKKLAQN